VWANKPPNGFRYLALVNSLSILSQLGAYFCELQREVRPFGASRLYLAWAALSNIAGEKIAGKSACLN